MLEGQGNEWECPRQNSALSTTSADAQSKTAEPLSQDKPLRPRHCPILGKAKPVQKQGLLERAHSNEPSRDLHYKHSHYIGCEDSSSFGGTYTG